ncbi:DUF2510 domain-containing protein [Rhodococcus sp. NPDC049939]|uniref:DUF2510 domain-containing protein n=1 Tax=Rhodococcus sp. NPDC049939 TaxID=3155511 RepID=UPI003410EE89
MTQIPGDTPKKKRPKWLVVLLSVVAVFVALAVIGEIAGPPEEDMDDTAAEPTTQAEMEVAMEPSAEAEAPAPPAPAEAPAAEAPAPVEPPAAPRPVFNSDPRCAPADEALVALVASGLTKAGQDLINGTVIQDDGLTFLGATTVDSTGKMKNRSDVWVISDSLPYSSTGGARNGTSWPKASSALGVSAGDERVQAVDECVVNITRN